MPLLRTSVSIALLVSGAVVVACGGDPGSLPIPPPAPPPDLGTGTPDVPVEPAPLICAEASGTYAASREPSNVMFLVDRSGSMHIVLPSKQTRWQATKKGFFELIGALPQTTGAGLMLFPQGDAPVNAYCGIDATANDVSCKSNWPEPSQAARCNASKYVASVPSGLLTSDQATSMRDQVTASDKSFYWGTPLATALTAAISAQKASTLPGAKSVILLTDGNPTSCDDTISNDISNVVKAAAKGLQGTLVRTFVIGLVDSSQQAAKASNLSPIAVAGGTRRTAACAKNDSCFYKLTDANFAADLKKVFEEISLQAFDCTFNLPEATAGADPALLNVQYSNATGTHTVAKDESRANGWDYLPNKSQIQLYGKACTDMKDAAAKLQIVMGCQTVVPSTSSVPSVKQEP